jgi:hypothetical protein
MRLSATYVYEGDTIFAFHGNTLITHGTEHSAVEQTAVDYLNNLVKKDKEDDNATEVKSARFIETLNGLKGEILGNVKGLWDDEITVRWENGRIAKYDTRLEGKYTKTAGTGEPESALDYLTKTLDADYGRDKTSLSARLHDLDGVVAKVAAIVGTDELPAADARRLDGIALAAEHEQNEIREALAHLEQADYESFIPVEPFKASAVEQASLGQGAYNERVGRGGSWLDETIDDMIREADSTDFDRLLLEGPGQFVVDVDTAALADQGVTAQLAQTFIESKTAGLVGEAVEDYRKQFLAKAEIARRQELLERQRTARVAAEKQVEQEKSDNLPDESLFM